MKRIIVRSAPGRKTSRTARTYDVRDAKRRAKLGRSGMFTFSFTLIKDQASAQIISEKIIKTDSYDEAVEYARIHTPPMHQGLIDGTSVVCK